MRDGDVALTESRTTYLCIHLGLKTDQNNMSIRQYRSRRPWCRAVDLAALFVDGLRSAAKLGDDEGRTAGKESTDGRAQLLRVVGSCLHALPVTMAAGGKVRGDARLKYRHGTMHWRRKVSVDGRGGRWKSCPSAFRISVVYTVN